MKRHFTNIDELHNFIERQAARIIKWYYTDFKNYDRVSIMKNTGLKTENCYIIFRESGSYFYTLDDLTDTTRDYPAVVMDYYKTDKTAKYYRIDFKHLTVENIPAGLPENIKRIRATF